MRCFLSFVVSILLVLIFFSCEKEVDWENNAVQSDALVVEAVLTNEFKYQQIKLSHPKSNIGDVDRPVSQAIISVTDGAQEYLFIEDHSIKGTYLSEVEFAASINKTYFLDLTFGEKTYTAQTGMKAIKPFNLLSIEQEGQSDFYKILHVASMYDATEQALYEVLISSDSVITDVDTSQAAKLFFYTFNTLDVGEVFAPNKGECLFYKGAKIIERKYALTDDYAEFVRAMAAEKEWQGSFFSETSANLPCNIEGKNVLGYFTACTVLEDSLIVN